MKSFSILRTNTGLTTNMKIMVDSKYGLYLESIDSMPELTLSKYKKVQFNKENYFDELVPFFFNGLSTDISYSIKYDKDNDNMSHNFSKQYDDMYQMGARNITDNKNYSEEFECFAPLYVNKTSLPSNFIVFRIDGPGLLPLTKDNFRDEILNKLKCVKIFDMTKKSILGEWLDRNITSNKNFPSTPFELDFKRLEFSKWNGINYETGGYTYKSFFLDSTLEKENTLFDLDKLVFDGYRNNKVVFPNIINFSFLFDDTPATPKSLRKWSINRYFGFYVDNMDLVDSVTPNLLPKLKNDVIITTGNRIYSPSGENPFVEDWKDNLLYYVEYKGNFYKVEKYTETLPKRVVTTRRNRLVTEAVVDDYQTRYRIISDIDLYGKQAFLNKKIVTIDENNYLLNIDQTYYSIPDFDSADVWIIEIDGVYHNIVKDGTKAKVYTDYAFSFPPDKFEYWINENDPSYKKSVSLIVDQNNPPRAFKIFRLKFTDIKDFDTAIVDTEYSKYEYEKKSDLTTTDEPKMYTVDLRSNSNPKDLNDYNYKDTVTHIPVSSEYTANYETFRIFNKDLTELWRKNSTYCRWVYQDSLSANDYPYLMNNSTLFEDFNRSVNPFDINPKRIERNLDYFYTINSSTASYIHHSLHIENNNGGVQDFNFKFELDKYLGLGTYSGGTYSFDYFTYFFDRKSTFDNGNIVKMTKKYSLMNTGDNVIPNTTVFRGLKFRLYDVETIKSNQGVIENINLKNINTFEDYKFSILLSKNEKSISDNNKITSSTNNMQWSIIENWEMDKSYASGSVVLLDDILYQAIDDTKATVPARVMYGTQVKSAPYNDPDWITYTYSYGVVNTTNSGSPFWNPNTDQSYMYGYGGYGDVVYNHGEYYRKNVSGTVSFWNPNLTYSVGSMVLYRGQYYTSNINSNIYPPNTGIMFRQGTSWVENWSVTSTPDTPNWVPIEVWNPSKTYTGEYVVHNEILYQGSGASGDEPGVSTSWNRIYSMKQDTNFIYMTASNPFVEMNNKIYLINSNSNNSTLENGINIYINKKWKNILVNIFINDNTITNLSNSDRDSMYTDLNKKLTAYNFMQCINDISNKYGFSDYLNYITISEDGTIKKVNINNISELKYYMTCETPDELLTKVDSLIYNPVTLGNNIIKVTKALKNGKILDISQLDYYNDIPMATEISTNKEESSGANGPSYHGGKVITDNQIYRYSGHYMPLFYDIELFSRQGITQSNVGNYLFDTSYSKFGTIKQRIISKINRNDNLLKLKNNNSYKSIYPMIDEFGYTFVDFFIFKSTWDIEYHYECKKNEEVKTKALPTSATLANIPETININTNLSL